GSMSAPRRAVLHGLTAEEIVAAAAQLESEQAARARADMRAAIQAEIASLVQKQERAFAAREALASVQVTSVRLPSPRGSAENGQTGASIEVTNGTVHRVSRIYVEL